MADLIEADPRVMMGKPVVRGTRITVQLILEKLAAGESIDAILQAHPRLTREADRLFPDAYAELNVALIDAVGKTFGPEGMQRLLDTRLARQSAEYAARITLSAPLAKKLEQLARVRTDEGYMAEVKRDGRGFLFIENHCPICAAATLCQGFCATELDLFRKVLGPGVSVERAEHIVSGDRRCAYRISACGAPANKHD